MRGFWKLILLICSMLPPSTASCNFTVDTLELRKGLIRGGTYFESVGPDADSKATATVEGCAALCCRTDGCKSYSLNVPWTLGTWLNCSRGQPCCALASTAGPFKPNIYPRMNITTGLVTGPPSTGKPPGASRSFDCAVRQLAYEYAKQLRPDQGTFPAVHDALQLEGCSIPMSREARSVSAASPAPPLATPLTEFFVSPNGSDVGSGTLASPFATPRRGIEACRLSASACTVTLRGGVYYLADSPLQLTAEDSGLTLRSFAGESAQLSGAEPLTGLAWTRAHLRHGTDSVPVWQAPLRAPLLSALRSRDTGRRVTRARHVSKQIRIQ